MANKFNLDGFSVDEDNKCTADGGFAGLIFQLPEQLYVLSAAISPSLSLVALSSSGGVAEHTLAKGVSNGQRMSLICMTYVSALTVISNFGGTITTATFHKDGDCLDLIYYSNNWYITGNNGVTLT